MIATLDDVRASATLAELAHALSGVPRLREGAGPALRSYDVKSDIAVAARHLNVHPNTCRYRLARAEEIAKITLTNPDERLLLWLQLRLGNELVD